jgi:hypothetical protein
MMVVTKVLCIVPVAVMVALLTVGSPCRAAQEVNLAAGKSYTLDPAPNYADCINEADATELTDGHIITEPTRSLWTSDGCVGWSRVQPAVVITIDLGQVEPISGAAFYTAAGTAGVAFPLSIAVDVSEDGQIFHRAGDLVRMMEDPLPPAYGAYALACFRTYAFKTHGRYVRLRIAAADVFTFVDEIEIYAGDPSWVDQPYPTATDVPEDLYLTRLGVYQRIRRDIEWLQTTIDNKVLRRELAQLRVELEQSRYPDKVEGFRAIVPVNDMHARVLAVHGKWLASRGTKPLTIWHSDPYELLAPMEIPREAARTFDVRLMNAERRPEVFNVTNATGEARQVRFSLQGLPGGANPDHVRVFEVQSVDTREFAVVSSALLPLKVSGGHYHTTVPAGVTRQIWLAFEPTDVEPGAHRGQLILQSDGFHRELPMTMTVSTIRFPEQVTMDTFMWDYVVSNSYAIDPSNQQAARDFLANDPIMTGVEAGPGELPRPTSIHADGTIGPIGFSAWDAYVAMFPDKRVLSIFAAFNPRTKFLNQQRGTDAFNDVVAQWAKAWETHNRELGLRPKQVHILFIDEPGDAASFEATAQFCEAFRGGSDAFTLFNDPSGRALNQEHGWRLVEASDIVCPTATAFNLAADDIQQRLRDLPSRGKQLWIYQCTGPTRHFDASYFRLQAWQAFMNNATGSAFWAFGDTGNAASSWNGYNAVGATSYTAVYIDPTSIHTSKHYEAVREGAMDYEYLAMLKQRVEELRKAGVTNKTLSDAEQLLALGIEQMFEPFMDVWGRWYGTPAGQCAAADQVRLKVLTMLEALESRASR